jgi:PKD domain
MDKGKRMIPIIIVVAVIVVVLVVGVVFVYPTVKGFIDKNTGDTNGPDGDDDDNNNTTPNKPPKAKLTIGNSTYEVGDLVEFNGNGSSDDKANATSNGILKYRWDFGDGSTPIDTTDPITTHAYTAPDKYNITMTVYDAEFLSSSDKVSIKVVWAQETISLGPAVLLGEPIFAGLGVIGNSTELAWPVKSGAQLMNLTITVAGADFRGQQTNQVSVVLLDPDNEVIDNQTVTVMGSTQIIWEYYEEDITNEGDWMLQIVCSKGAAYISVQGYVSYI